MISFVNTIFKIDPTYQGKMDEVMLGVHDFKYAILVQFSNYVK